MYKKLLFICVTIAIIMASETEAKGGRGGGGGRSGGKSRGGFSRSKNSGIGKSGSLGNFGGTHNSIHTTGGWFHGFFHSTPYHYTYRPSYVGRNGRSSVRDPNGEEEETDSNKDTSNYAVGYSISRALSGDFFSIFKVVQDISKYPSKIRNKEVHTTTTEGPVLTYNLNDIVTPIYSINEFYPKPYDSDDHYIWGKIDSEEKAYSESMQEVLKKIEKTIEKFNTTL